MSLSSWEALAVIFTSVTGTALHFVYSWTHQNKIARYVAPVNESPWEHLKRLFSPCVLFTVLAEWILFPIPGFILAHLLGIMSGMGCILAIFYLHSGILERNYLLDDIIAFFADVFAASCGTLYWLSKGQGDDK